MRQQLDDEPTVAASLRRRNRFDVHIDRHLMVDVSGEADVITAPRFATKPAQLADDGGGVVWVDFSNLAFCGAAGINVLLVPSAPLALVAGS